MADLAPGQDPFASGNGDPFAADPFAEDWTPAKEKGMGKKLVNSVRRMWDTSIPSEGMGYDLAANIGVAALPGALAYRGVTAIPRLAQATSKLGRLAKHTLAGSAAGTAGAAATNSDMGEGAVYGAVTGPVASVLSKVPGFVAGVFRGPKKEASREMGRIFGDRTPEARDAVRYLRANVPGEQLSSGRAATARLPEFKVLEQATRNRPGSHTLLQMDEANKAAQEAALIKYAAPAQKGVAPGMGQPVPPSKLKDVRTRKTKPLYAAAEKDRAPFTPAMKEAMLGAEVRPLNLKAAKAFDQSRANLTAQGKSVPGGTATPRQMISVKQGQEVLKQVDDKIGAIERATLKDAASIAELKRLKDARKIIVTGLEKGSPRYAEANRLYGKLMKADRQGKLADELLTHLRGGSYLDAARNPAKTLKASGAPDYQQFEQVASPQQLQAIRGVEKSVAQKAAYDALPANRGTVPEYLSPFDVAAEHTPGVFSQTYTIFRAAMKKLGAKSDEAVQRIVDEAVKDPRKMEQLLNNVPSARRQAFMETIKRSATGAAAGAAGTSGEQNAP